MEYVIKNREPADALRFFEEISAIPRGSHNEKEICEYLEKFAKERGLEVYTDELYNVFIKKPGTKGYENLPPLLLHGHTDIVCEKNKDTVHDFKKDPLRLKVKDNILTADGTTLGADDGYAIAYMMAILDRNDIPHPPLECLMTSQEETGLGGMEFFDKNLIAARRMLNLDIGGDGDFLASSAGGCAAEIILHCKRTSYSGGGLKISVRGLQGGHSGGKIHLERGNSNKIIGRILYDISKEMEVLISFMDGGDKDNAIPRECDCIIGVANPKRAAEIAARAAEDIKAELMSSDPGLDVTCEENTPKEVFDAEASEKIIALQHLLISGVQMKSMDIEDLVNASANFASVKTLDEGMRFTVSLRGAADSLSKELADRVVHLCKVIGAKCEIKSAYPAFPFAKTSPLRDMALALYKERTGKEGRVTAVHGGTECGIAKKAFPDMDITSLGPISEGHHTPEEWMDLDSFREAFELLLALLKKMGE